MFSYQSKKKKKELTLLGASSGHTCVKWMVSGSRSARPPAWSLLPTRPLEHEGRLCRARMNDENVQQKLHDTSI